MVTGYRRRSMKMVSYCRRIWCTFILLGIVFFFSCSLVIVCAVEGGDDADGAEDFGDSSTSATSDLSAPSAVHESHSKEKIQPPSGSGDDWGSFYDPNNVFCGKYDCYKILGFDHETWGDDPPSLKDISKSYRSLSRKWHPDKNKAKGSREKFVAIAKAYEVLTNVEKRAEYDHFRHRPDKYFLKYGSSVLWSYAPKSDASIIIIVFLIAGSALTFYAQKNKWQTIANHLVKAAVEDLSPREGGSTESIEIREKALAILAEKKRESNRLKEINGAGDKKRKGPKMTAKERREKEMEDLRPICIVLVNEIDDFGAGFRKPTMQDLLVVKMVKWPYYLTRSTVWWSQFALRRIQKLELNEEERKVLTKNAVGEVTWVAVSDDERKKMLMLELWITDNLVEWREEQEMKLAGLSANRRKQIKKLKKRGGAEFLEEDMHLD